MKKIQTSWFENNVNSCWRRIVQPSLKRVARHQWTWIYWKSRIQAWWLRRKIEGGWIKSRHVDLTPRPPVSLHYGQLDCCCCCSFHGPCEPILTSDPITRVPQAYKEFETDPESADRRMRRDIARDRKKKKGVAG